MNIRDDVHKNVVDLEESSPPLVDLSQIQTLMETVEMDTMVGPEMALSEALPGLVSGEPTALLCDCNNLYKRAESHGFQISYERLRRAIANRCDLRYSGAFNAGDPDDPKFIKWVEAMEDIGYDVVTKPIRRFRVDDKLITKGNMDVELTLAARDLSDGFAHVIIATCDSDFEALIRRLKVGNLRKVSFMGMKNSRFQSITKSLIDSADNFYDLLRIKDYIALNRVRHG